MHDFLEQDEMPLGFSMALAQNTRALERFSALPEREKKSVIQGAREVGSKREMRAYVNAIGDRGGFY